MSRTPAPHWADVLTLRSEVRATDGSVGELQMSLAKAVYQTVPVPYAQCDYYTDITQPTPTLVGFLARVARRLGVPGMDAHACFHLDQGMGGGKSHALVGLWHMIHTPGQFFGSDLGHAVLDAAGTGGHPVDLDPVQPVVLTCDGFSPGKTDPRFGPATDLFGRFLWSLFADHPDRMSRYQHYTGMGPNKATLQAAFAETGRPVLVLIDELMDYVMALTDQSQIGGMPGEQAFLNALTDAVDDQPNVALVLVMIRSEEDQAGYHPQADALRGYLTPRLQRNGETVTVTEPADFAQIIRRRLFTRADIHTPATDTGQAFADAASTSPWDTQVYAGLGAGHGPAGMPDRVTDTYPFHPDLFALVSREWTVVQAFQRVRSTVAIFARTALHWVTEHQAGRWAPPLIGVGDIPLHTDALEALLSSGVLAGNDRAIQGYRAVATTDVLTTSGTGGTAHTVDQRLTDGGVDASQPHPAVRMATACFAYSLVPRPRGHRGATKAEMLAAIHDPGVSFTAAEEVFNALVVGPADGGLGALERARPTSGRGPERFYLSIKQTLTMYHANATTMVSGDDALDRMWTRTQTLASKGPFTALHPVDRDTGSGATAFAGLDSQQNRLVVLDPRRWTLLNGRDTATRTDLDTAYGISPGLPSNFAASMVVVLANTQRRDRARAYAKDLLAWELVLAQLAPDAEEHPEATQRRNEAAAKLDDAIRRAYQHYAYLLRSPDGLTVQYKTIPETHTSLSGNNVWAALVGDGRAVTAGALAASYVAELIRSGGYGRHLTPKELFEQPYANPAWPLIVTDADLRRAIFELATSDEWMLVDSDNNEIRPGTPDHIAAATLQQTLRPRPEPDTGTTDSEPSPGATTATTPGTPPTTTTTPQPSSHDAGYQLTTIEIPYTSITDLARRDQAWQLVREIASLLDPAKAATVDLQMIGFTLTINARQGDTESLVTKAEQSGIATSGVTDEDF